jgi:hypothetical protein
MKNTTGSKIVKKTREKDNDMPVVRLPRAKAAFLLVFLLGIVCGVFIAKFLSTRESLAMIEMRPGGYEFINPLLEVTWNRTKLRKSFVETEGPRACRRKEAAGIVMWLFIIAI